MVINSHEQMQGMYTPQNYESIRAINKLDQA